MSININNQFIVVCIIYYNIIGIITYRRTLRKWENDQSMIHGVQNGLDDNQLIEICKRNKIKYPRDTVAFYRYYYQMKDKQ